ncbi:MAG TPA: RNase adapter RapZ [Gammaproteobacteria bacterium]
MRIIFLSGLSGSGKTVALHMLEDLGYTSLDNFPIRLLRDYVAQEVGRSTNRRIAIGVDARAGYDDLQILPAIASELREAGIDCEVIFLTSDDDTLVRRYSETRRRHPLAQEEGSVSEAIQEERAVLSNIAEHADLKIDTTHLNVHDLREIIRHRLKLDGGGELSLMFMSFGYKNGVPRDADFVFDLRCLPNPHWENALRPLTGRDAAVVDYLHERDSVVKLREDIIDFLDKWIPCFEGADRSYLTIALGCTGGRHRSVYMAEQLAAYFGRKHPKVLVRHSSLAEVFDARQLDLALEKREKR